MMDAKIIKSKTSVIKEIYTFQSSWLDGSERSETLVCLQIHGSQEHTCSSLIFDVLCFCTTLQNRKDGNWICL